MRNHYYKNHEHVISVLTKEYGFKYTGLGDNYEECFFKDSKTPEQIYVHPMGCSYYMFESKHWSSGRIHSADFQSNRDNEKDQEKAFMALLVHLDKFTVPFDVKTLQQLLISVEIETYFNYLCEWCELCFKAEKYVEFNPPICNF